MIGQNTYKVAIIALSAVVLVATDSAISIAVIALKVICQIEWVFASFAIVRTLTISTVLILTFYTCKDSRGICQNPSRITWLTIWNVKNRTCQAQLIAFLTCVCCGIQWKSIHTFSALGNVWRIRTNLASTLASYFSIFDINLTLLIVLTMVLPSSVPIGSYIITWIIAWKRIYWIILATIVFIVFIAIIMRAILVILVIAFMIILEQSFFQ